MTEPYRHGSAYSIGFHPSGTQNRRALDRWLAAYLMPANAERGSRSRAHRTCRSALRPRWRWPSFWRVLPRPSGCGRRHPQHRLPSAVLHAFHSGQAASCLVLLLHPERNEWGSAEYVEGPNGLIMGVCRCRRPDDGWCSYQHLLQLPWRGVEARASHHPLRRSGQA